MDMASTPQCSAWKSVNSMNTSSSTQCLKHEFISTVGKQAMVNTDMKHQDFEDKINDVSWLHVQSRTHFKDEFASHCPGLRIYC